MFADRGRHKRQLFGDHYATPTNKLRRLSTLSPWDRAPRNGPPFNCNSPPTLPMPAILRPALCFTLKVKPWNSAIGVEASDARDYAEEEVDVTGDVDGLSSDSSERRWRDASDIALAHATRISTLVFGTYRLLNDSAAACEALLRECAEAKQELWVDSADGFAAYNRAFGISVCLFSHYPAWVDAEGATSALLDAVGRLWTAALRKLKSLNQLSMVDLAAAHALIKALHDPCAELLVAHGLASALAYVAKLAVPPLALGLPTSWNALCLSTNVRWNALCPSTDVRVGRTSAV